MANDPRLVLYGAGGHAGVVLSVARAAGMTIGAVYADEASSAQSFAAKKGLAVLDATAVDVAFHLAIGENRVRRAVCEKADGRLWFAVRHPSAIVADDAEIAEGVFIGAGAIVQTGAKIGRHVIVNTGAIIEHDCVVGDFCHVAPGAVLSGDVTLGAGVLIGAGATVMKGRRVEAWTDIGAGAAVVKDIAGFRTAAGVPARGKKPK